MSGSSSLACPVRAPCSHPAICATRLRTFEWAVRHTGAEQEVGGCMKRSMTSLSPRESDEEDKLSRIRHGSLGASFDRIKHGMLEAMVGLEGHTGLGVKEIKLPAETCVTIAMERHDDCGIVFGPHNRHERGWYGALPH
jgi:hypothetical protein